MEEKKTVPVTSGVGGPVIGEAVVAEDGTATFVLNKTPEAQAIVDQIVHPLAFGISSQGGKKKAKKPKNKKRRKKR